MSFTVLPVCVCVLHLLPVGISLQEVLGVRVVLLALVNWSHKLLQENSLLLQDTCLRVVFRIGIFKTSTIFIHQTGDTRGREGGWGDSNREEGRRREEGGGREGGGREGGGREGGRREGRGREGGMKKAGE